MRKKLYFFSFSLNKIYLCFVYLFIVNDFREKIKKVSCVMNLSINKKIGNVKNIFSRFIEI